MSPATISGPAPISLEGCNGSRYWIHDPYPFTGTAAIDERLSGYPLVVFQPHGRPVDETPVVIGLQGMAVPYQWNGFLIPTLLDMGIACVLFDAPFAGERSLARTSNGNIVSELLPLSEKRIPLSGALVYGLMDVVARDIGTALQLARERHGLRNERVALFGVSLGTLLTSFAFMRDGIGQRLLGTLGHPNLRRFARSYAPSFAPLLVSPPARLLGKLAARYLGPGVSVGLDFLAVLGELSSRVGDGRANPMTFADRVTADRRVRFLVGREDPLVKPSDATACAKRFADGACYVVPGLGHGDSRFGPTFVEHARTFVGTQLGDWKW